MRAKVIFDVEGEKMPILYRHRFMDLIISALAESNRDYKLFLYPEDKTDRKIVKPFTFSVMLPQNYYLKKEKFKIFDFEVEDIVFYLSNDKRISLFISSCSYEFFVNLYNGLLSLKEFKFSSDLTLKLSKVYMLNERKINSKEVVLKTMSPILIETANDKPIIPFDESGDLLKEESLSVFNEEFNALHNRILKDIRGFQLYEKLFFSPVKIRKQVVKHALRDFTKQTGKPYMILTTFEGIFKLRGDPKDLLMLYQLGIGLRTGQGFGMVEVIT
ncbi:CRISPR-associated endoribonuclease Cas6 [Caldisericum exile]|uniref:CRISPR-associated protein n=1 Tax=Caldisericum exile (strain DSM 21853 / NBRC 104410 / AZM16c01) TaxID=511051 RepID=A0A7U6GDH9_CALEA|nr:CRISPR-associated endoribonuclease Cas6 [Caldisericum exile]BAL80394.1 putative CRISPR-associated protein [Caldisericum exile AZM16c01]